MLIITPRRQLTASLVLLVASTTSRPSLCAASAVAPAAPAAPVASARSKAQCRRHLSSSSHLQYTGTQALCKSKYRPKSKSKPELPEPAAYYASELRISKPSPLPSAQLFESYFVTDDPDVPLVDALDSLFTKNPATFYYGNHEFYYLRKNTRVPEVCILGRSNVGKSSLVNALANRQTSELAHTSKKAGRTRSMNAYSLGPPPRLPKELTGAQYKGKEDLPTHGFYLVDMPGYGNKSLRTWGQQITLYLTKRTAVKAAIVLIDAKVGPKSNDWEALQLLAKAGLPTTFIITKADKVKSPNQLDETVNKLLEGTRRLEYLLPAESTWSWDREIYVTAVGAQSPMIVRATVSTARLAVAKLAGWVEDKRPKEEKGRKWGGNVVSFEDLMYAPSTATPDSTAKQRSVGNAADRPGSDSVRELSQHEDISDATHQNSIHGPKRPRMNSPAYSPASHQPGAGSQTRTFRTSRTIDSLPHNLPPGPPPPGSEELKRILSEFCARLEATENRPRDLVRKNMLELENRAPRRRKNREALIWKRSSARFPEQTERVKKVKQERLAREEARLSVRERKRREKDMEEKMAQDYGKYANTFDSELSDVEREEGADEEEMTYAEYAEQIRAAASKRSGKSKRGSKDKAKTAKQTVEAGGEELDPFDAEFAKRKTSRDDGGRRRSSKPSF